MSGVLILGAGGHAKVVADILIRQEIPLLGFVDDNPATWGSLRLGLPVLGPIDSLHEHGPSGLVLGVGSNAIRKQLVERLGPEVAPLWINAVHPRAILAASVSLGVGVVLAAGAIVNPDSAIGDHAIINTGATVDHDCDIGAYAHVAPGVHLAGGVSIGEGTLLGVGSSVIPYHTVGAWAIIGAGAAVVGDVPDRVVARGVPARWEST